MTEEEHSFSQDFSGGPNLFFDEEPEHDNSPKNKNYYKSTSLVRKNLSSINRSKDNNFLT